MTREEHSINQLKWLKSVASKEGTASLYPADVSVFGMAIKDIEKQIPTKPVYTDYTNNGFDEIIPHTAKCPYCGQEFKFGTWNNKDSHHCKCGQTIDWE